MKTVVGLFDTYAHAEKAAQDLEQAGIAHNDISLVASNASEQFAKNPEAETPHGSAIVKDAEIGAGIGGVLGLMAGASLFIIPGLGWLAGAGWFAGMLGGAAVGGIAGGLIGALTQVGVPEEDASYYNEGVRRGGTLLTVRAEDSLAPRVAQILSEDGAVNIDERAAAWKQEGFLPSPLSAATAQATTPPQIQPTTPAPALASRQTNLDSGAEAVLPVVEEELTVGKREVERGGVRVYTHVTQKPVQEQVQLREEHVNVERRPVDRPVTSTDMAAFQEGTIEVTETAEVPVISKEARVVEEVVVGKEVTERTETVQDTVQRTDVQVEQIAGSEHTGRTDTRGVVERVADAATGDRIDDKTGKPIP